MDGWLTAFATSTVLVAVAEIGDKTQLLSFALAARYRKPWTIVAAILVATLTNHALAGSVGVLIAQWLEPRTTALIVGTGFIAFGVWALVPDQLDQAPKPHGGVFMTTLIAFFIAEMGDKTQLATIGLGARFASIYAVVLGTTFGMMLANLPAVLIGHRLAEKLPMHLMRWTAAALFFLTGLLTLVFAPD